MEIASVKARCNFVPSEPCWEQLIKDRQRTTAPLSSIEDPVVRNKVITQKERERGAARNGVKLTLKRPKNQSSAGRKTRKRG